MKSDTMLTTRSSRESQVCAIRTICIYIDQARLHYTFTGIILIFLKVLWQRWEQRRVKKSKTHSVFFQRNK